MYLKKHRHILRLRPVWLGIIIALFFGAATVYAAANTWTFNASTAGDYTYDSSLVVVDNTGAGPIPGVNKIINPSFESSVTSWTYQAVTALTTSGGLITDATRTTSTDGDGATPPAGYGIWSATTNLITNGGMETNSTGWNNNAQGNRARSTAQAKFGAASLLVTSTGAGNNSTITGGTNSLTGAPITQVPRTFSIWVLGSGTTIGKTLSFQVNESGGAFADQAYGNVSPSMVVLTSSWQRLTLTGTTFRADRTSIYAFVSTPSTGTGEIYYVDGFQAEQLPLATPYVETNGSTATRTGGRVQVPVSNVFTPTQGWIAIRMKMGWGNTREPGAGTGFPVVWYWGDNQNNALRVYYVESTNSWQLDRRSTVGVNQGISIADNLAVGDYVTVITWWDATRPYLSIDGSASPASSGIANIPVLSASTFDIGRSAIAGGSWFDSDFLWSAAGSGTLTDADAAAINAFGNTPPETSSFPETSVVTGLWPAVTSAWTSGSLYRNTTTKYLSSAASGKLYASQDSNFTQNINVGNTDTYTFDAYVYTDGSAVSSSDVSLFYNGSTISTTYTSMGDGWYKLTGSLTGANASRSYGLRVLSGKTVYIDDLTLYKTGNYTVFNTNALNVLTVTSWDSFSQSITADNNSGVTYQICLDDSTSCSYSSGSRWQYYTGGVWINAVDASATYSNTASQLTEGAMTALPIINHKITVKSIFSFGGIYSPSLSSLSVGYSTPTPTDAPSSGGGGSSPQNNNPSPQTCSQTPPLQAPNLYAAVAQNGNSTLLYFTNGQTPLDHYSLEFGTSSGNYQYGADNIGGSNSRTYLVSFLSPNTTYYFRVRGGNGCAPGPWSNELSSKTLGLISFNNLAITDTNLSSNANNSTVQKIASAHPTVTKKPTPTPTRKVGANLTPTKAFTPTPTMVTITSPTNAQDATESAELQNQEGYSVSINVKNEEGEPIEGAEVTVHSKVQTGKTDKNGVVRFTNVERGEHRVLIAYNGFNGEQSVNLTGDVKEFSLTVTVKPSIFSISPLAIIIILILLVVIIAMAVLLRRKGGPPRGKSFRFFSRNSTVANGQSGT